MQTHGHCRSQFASRVVSGKKLWLGRFPRKYFVCLLLFFPKPDRDINVYTFHDIFFLVFCIVFVPFLVSLLYRGGLAFLILCENVNKRISCFQWKWENKM